jgi:hypothetical protein
LNGLNEPDVKYTFEIQPCQLANGGDGWVLWRVGRIQGVDIVKDFYGASPIKEKLDTALIQLNALYDLVEAEAAAKAGQVKSIDNEKIR